MIEMGNNNKPEGIMEKEIQILITKYQKKWGIGPTIKTILNFHTKQTLINQTIKADL